MNTISLEDAQARLPDLIAQLAPGEELVITRDTQAVARLVGDRPQERKPRVPGTMRGILTIVSDDDEHLKDFEEYMS